MRLFQKAKRLGTWDPQALDLSRDAADWNGFTDLERDFLLRTLVLFQAGEEGVTSDPLPLIMVTAAEGRPDEEIYLTSVLWQASKHVEIVCICPDQVSLASGYLASYVTTSYS